MARPQTIKVKMVVLKLFEKLIKNYHPFFQNEDEYVLNYVIQRITGKGFQISVILTITGKTGLDYYLDDPKGLNQVLTSYCKFFNISRITIDRPYFIYVSEHLNKPVPKPLNERVKIGYFTNIE